MKKRKYIKASDFSQWEFCPKQWYYQKTMGRRVTSEASRKGIVHHNELSKGVKSAQKEQSRFFTLLAIGGIVCCLLSLLW